MAIGSSSATTAAGTIFSVSAAVPVAPATAITYAALTWVEVAEVTSIGARGKTFEVVTHKPLAYRGTYKRKGSYDNGQMAIGLAIAKEDDGQDLLTAALESDNSYAFKIEFPSGRIQYMPGQVSSFTDDDIGSTDAILAGTVNVEVDGDIITVPAP
jgi:hypothetical protein